MGAAGALGRWLPSRPGGGEGNGFSHLRASLVGPSLTIPFSAGRLALGTWQQVVLADFDSRPRHRQVVLQIMGE